MNANAYTVQTPTVEFLLPVFQGDRPAAFAFMRDTLGKSDLCRRCGGSGEFLYNFLDGTRCYGCNGKGKIGASLTKKEMATIAKHGIQGFLDRRAIELAKAEAKRAADAEKAAIAAAKLAEEEAARKAEEAAAKAQAEAEAAAAKDALYQATQHIGAIGQRVEMTLTLKKVVTGERRSFSGYGMETWNLSVFEAEDGSSVIWWNAFPSEWKGEEWIEAPAAGDVIRVKATVKAHGRDKYTGAKQTEIQRAKRLA